ncbi:MULTISPECIES: hypothetical protein [unclassified Isoptericola]|uniref:hypothetical protein n=1 Tax=unclassified Isoptericola TaxID=2623355 RepID=UPI00271352FC|nr:MULTISPECIES: hypothetical protein [unclassified Isoptericola]MDO8143711.1 hypothetical protein [Isoptericola sp. 178]MDO8150089.1 hypothetical protein [Isoptericola sp. b408]
MDDKPDDEERTEGTEVLEAMSADRQRLTQRVRVPGALMAAFGALGAWWVASAATTDTGADYQPPATAWTALLGVLVVVHLLQRETGIRFRALGARASWAIAGVVVACLGLFSVSLGLVSLDLRWAVAVTSLAAFGITTWLAGVACRSAVEQLGRG